MSSSVVRLLGHLMKGTWLLVGVLGFVGLMEPGPAFAQINNPVYASGSIQAASGTTVTTNIVTIANHPTDQTINNLGVITTWNIVLPNPTFDGQIIRVACGFTVGSLNVSTTDGTTLPPLISSCVPGQGFTLQLVQRYNQWILIGAEAGPAMPPPFPLSVANGGTGQTSFTVGNPILGNGVSGLTQGTVSGNTTLFATVGATHINGNCAQFNSGNLIDSGAPCGSGGTGSGTVSTGTAGQLATYGSTGTTVVGTFNINGHTMTLNGSLTGNAISDWQSNSPTSSIFNSGGYLNSYLRYTAKLATASGPQQQIFAGCDNTVTNTSIQENDCAWFQSIDDTADGFTNAVGVRSEGDIATTVTNGFAWGGIDYAQIYSGGDGQLIGREIDVDNNGGGNVASPLSAKMKVGLWIGINSGIGYNNGTAAIGLTGSKWYNGLWAQTSNFVTGGDYIWLDNGVGNPLFNVASNGNVGIQGHVQAGILSNVPSPSSCGSSPIVSGNDYAGHVTMSGSPTSCSLVFHTAYSSAPNAVLLTNTNQFNVWVTNVTATGFTINGGGGLGEVFYMVVQ